MKKLSQNQMEETQGGVMALIALALLVGIAVGYIIGDSAPSTF